VGVIRDVAEENVYDTKVAAQIEDVKAKSKIASVDDLLRSGETWTIE